MNDSDIDEFALHYALTNDPVIAGVEPQTSTSFLPSRASGPQRIPASGAGFSAIGRSGAGAALRRLSAALLAAALLFAPIAQASAGAEPPSVSDVNSEKGRAAIDARLKPGAGEQSVLSLLGEPFSITKAPMVWPSDPGKDGLHRWTDGGEEWRYEWPDAHLLVYISEKGKLTGRNWILPNPSSKPESSGGELRPQPYEILSGPLKLTPSIKPELDWRANIDVDYAYLEYANDDMLLVRGDDGGFSGFHMSSVIYGLDRVSGKTLWKRDVGWNFPALLPDSTGESLTFDNYQPNDGINGEPLLYQIGLSDGKPLWRYEPSAARQGVLVAAAQGTVVAYRKAEKYGGLGTVAALDSKTGQVKWKQQVREPFGLLNEGADDPYVLLAQGTTLRALNPDTGKAVWSAEIGRADAVGSAVLNPANLPVAEKSPPERWVKIGGESWKKIDLLSGKTLAGYAINDSASFEDIGGGYLLVRQSKDDKKPSSQTTKIQTSLVEASSGRELWTLPAEVGYGRIENGTLYAIVDRIPSALSLDSGHTIWKAAESGADSGTAKLDGAGSFAILGGYLLLPYNRDLLAFDKATGEQIGRIDGFRFGYPETHDRLVQRSLLNIQHGKLYVGSASGSFAVLDTTKLEQTLDEAKASGRGAPAYSPQREAARWYPNQPY
ncbi:PQQ-binding-like beta-propeller repeat protein [Saccharibacillus sp. CPCC 101409]|uniref:outer membrane protein assembly factor BamB family protein n=1 Tax=Saccharibacillus sp. CPCC 101409 TaxID=3058041 RepID=UPI00267310C4|nr:PQQ-binding-like beta-propeller repeat protein [Saccharibacillus sp. CPCC 101409]MDO3411081.1 PQQ-binding-like beta-propeller repeat protein [Saccharibacillus sp. CPCC 101409]